MKIARVFVVNRSAAIFNYAQRKFRSPVVIEMGSLSEARFVPTVKSMV
jgi:hypothetical protein